MGRVVSALGTLLVVLSVVGFGWLFLGPSPEALIQGEAKPISQPVSAAVQRPAAGPAFSVPALSQPAQNGGAVPTPTLVPFVPTPQVATPIERVAIPAIGLDSTVEEATLVERGGALTWDIPKFKAGHAQGTAGAGDDGNAVLLGHVSSLRSGDVFKNLDKVQLGQEVILVNRGQRYVYEVVEITTVPRTDTSPLGTTAKPTVSLFTCIGTWLPTIWDYTDRLVVRGELRRIL